MLVSVSTVAVLLCLSAGLAPGASDMGSAPLRYALSAPAKVVAGEPVELRFSLADTSPQALWVLTWYTPLEGLLGDIFRVTRDGTRLEYRGPLVKRGDPERDDYVRIGPGQAVSSTVDLRGGWAVDEPGTYTVDFSGKVFDVAGNEGEIPRPRNAERPMEIPGSGCTFVVERP